MEKYFIFCLTCFTCFRYNLVVAGIMDVVECVEIATTAHVDETTTAAVQKPETSGGHVFVTTAGHCALENQLQGVPEGLVVYHKQFPGLKTPFDLPIECFPLFEAMLDEDPDCVNSVNIMLKGAVAQSTASNYKTVVNKFHAYCLDRGHAFPNFDTGAVIRFVKDCHGEGAGLSFFQKLLPSLVLLEAVLGVTTSAITGVVQQAVTAIKRELAATRGIVKKATGYSYTVISTLVAAEIAPFWAELHKIDAGHFRSILRAVIIYCTFCRFDEFSRLTDTNFIDMGDYIHVIFERRKNDQFGDNSRSVIPERPDAPACPVRIIRAYFQRFNLQFGGTGKMINFRLRKEAGRHIPLYKTSLSQSNATKFTRELLVKHGYNGAKFTEKSFKVQGVTALMDAGESAENVMVFGGWKRSTTPLHYRNMSANFLLGVAAKLPV